MGKIKIKGYYSRDGERFVGVEQDGVVYGFPAYMNDKNDIAISLTITLQLLGTESLLHAGFVPQTEKEKQRNVWESEDGASEGECEA